jgi:hypothetical protein
LVEGAAGAVHLICDDSHVLLAASPARTVGWRRTDLGGCSLWPFASPEIAGAEARLAALGWRAGGCDAVTFATGPNAAIDVPIVAGLVLWERLRLEDGRAVRLVSTVAAAPAHALRLPA